MKLIDKHDKVVVRYATNELAIDAGLADRNDLDVTELHAAVSMFIAGQVDRISIPNEAQDVISHVCRMDDGTLLVEVLGWEHEKFEAQVWKLQAEYVKLMIEHKKF